MAEVKQNDKVIMAALNKDSQAFEEIFNEKPSVDGN